MVIEPKVLRFSSPKKSMPVIIKDDGFNRASVKDSFVLPVYVALPPPANNKGSLIFSLGDVYVWDGTAWIPLGGSGNVYQLQSQGTGVPLAYPTVQNGPTFTISSLKPGVGIDIDGTLGTEVVINGTYTFGTESGTVPLVGSSTTTTDFRVKTLKGGSGVNLSSTGSEVTISSTFPTYSLNSPAGLPPGYPLVDGSPQLGPSFVVKNLDSGTGISLTNASDNVKIEGTYSFVSEPGSVSVVSSNSSAPAFVTKSFSSGTGITLNDVLNNIEIEGTYSLDSVGTGQSMIPAPSPQVGPAFTVKSLVAGTGIVINDNGNDLTITASGASQNYSLDTVGPGTSLVPLPVPQPGPAFTVKSLVAGAGIAVTDQGTNVKIEATGASQSFTLASIGTGASLVPGSPPTPQPGPAFTVKSIRGSTGITVVGNASEVTLFGNYTLSSTGGGTSLVPTPDPQLGPGFTVKSLTQGSSIVFDTSISNEVKIVCTALDSIPVQNWKAGTGSTVGASNTVSIGHNSQINAAVIQSVAIGSAAQMFSTASNSVAIGYGTSVTGSQSVALGSGTSSGNFGVAIGYQAATSAARAIAIGTSVTAASQSVGIGYQATTTANTVSIGYQANGGQEGVSAGFKAVSGTNGVVVGGNSMGIDNGVVVGHSSSASTGSVAIGSSSAGTGTSSISIGTNSDATGLGAIALGENAQSTSTQSIAIGQGSVAQQPNSIAIGQGVTNNMTNTALIGNSTSFITKSSGLFKSARQWGVFVIGQAGPAAAAIVNLSSPQWDPYSAISGNNIVIPDTTQAYLFSVSFVVSTSSPVPAYISTLINVIFTQGALPSQIYNAYAIGDISSTRKISSSLQVVLVTNSTNDLKTVRLSYNSGGLTVIIENALICLTRIA